MNAVEPTQQFIRTVDGTTLVRQANGSFHPVKSATSHAALEKISDDQIEQWSKSDPDHLGLDDAFWDHVELETPSKEAISIKLDSDVLKWFRRDGKGYQTRINSVLRHFVENVKKAG
jgi:uncharacterized protein (DUF4415 family)